MTQCLVKKDVLIDRIHITTCYNILGLIYTCLDDIIQLAIYINSGHIIYTELKLTIHKVSKENISIPSSM